jgi:hypothetical protein
VEDRDGLELKGRGLEGDCRDSPLETAVFSLVQRLKGSITVDVSEESNQNCNK